jgi:sugar phosphate isomerase/epimerase
MYPAVFARTYPYKTAVQVLDAVRADGYDGVQFNLSSIGLASLPDALPDGGAEAVGQRAAERRLAVAALSGTYNMAHPDEAVRLAARPRFANVVIAAVRMGAPIVSLCTGSRNPEDMWAAHPDNGSARAWSDFRRELDFVLHLADEAGLTVAVEPEPGNVVTDAKVARKLLDQVGNSRLGIILDAANLLSPETLPRQHAIMAEAVDLLGANIVLAHAKDIDAGGTVVAAGAGAVDLPELVRLLRASAYDGALIGHGFGPADAGKSAQALSALIGDRS